MSETKLKKCLCGGDVKLYSVCNPNLPYSAMARCTLCKKEYPLPNVKLRTWKSNPTRISRTMVKDAEKEWNKMQLN